MHQMAVDRRTPQADVLSEAFAPFGNIQSVKVVRDKGGTMRLPLPKDLLCPCGITCALGGSIWKCLGSLSALSWAARGQDCWAVCRRLHDVGWPSA